MMNDEKRQPLACPECLHIQREKLINFWINWGESETIVFVNNLQVCRIKTQIHRPFKLRLNADIDDYLMLTYISRAEENEMQEAL